MSSFCSRLSGLMSLEPKGQLDATAWSSLALGCTKIQRPMEELAHMGNLMAAVLCFSFVNLVCTLVSPFQFALFLIIAVQGAAVINFLQTLGPIREDVDLGQNVLKSQYILVWVMQYTPPCSCTNLSVCLSVGYISPFKP